MARIINLNSHPIRVQRPDTSTFEYPPDGRVFRLATSDEVVDTVNGNQIVKRVYYEPEEDIIPKYEPNTYYIVPSQITQIFDRRDFISPDTKGANGAKRDARGQVLSVTRFRMRDELQTYRPDF